MPVMKITKKYSVLIASFALILGVFFILESCKSRSQKKPELECDTDCQNPPLPVVGGGGGGGGGGAVTANPCSQDFTLSRPECKQDFLNKCPEQYYMYPERCGTVCSLDAYTHSYCASLAASCPDDPSDSYCIAYCSHKLQSEPNAPECQVSPGPNEEEPVIAEPNAETCAEKYTAPANCEAFWDSHCADALNKESEECQAFVAAHSAPTPDPVEPPTPSCSTDVSPDACAAQRNTICHADPSVTGCTNFFTQSCGTLGTAIATPSNYGCTYGGSCNFRESPSTSATIYFLGKSTGTAYKLHTDGQSRVWACLHIQNPPTISDSTKRQNFEEHNYMAWFCNANCSN